MKLLAYKMLDMRAAGTLTSTDRHAVFDNEFHQIFFHGGEKAFTRMIHQRNNKLQDFSHITDHHKITLSLLGHNKHLHSLAPRWQHDTTFCNTS